MKFLLDETAANARTFATEYFNMLQSTHDALCGREEEMIKGYRSAVSLQAWRVLLLSNLYNQAANDFFLEAQNDAVQSFVLAHMGLWRPALQSLRASVEGVYAAEYYKDHPIEYRLWMGGKHKLNYQDYRRYFDTYPKDLHTSQPIDPFTKLDDEYKQLSRAVHGSALPYRMTRLGTINISSSDVRSHSQWLDRHSRTICGLNLFLIAMYSDYLQGSSLRNLRKSISFAVPVTMYSDIKSRWGIRLFPT